MTEAALWKRLSAARTAFAKRRKVYFAGLDEQREGIRSAKERDRRRGGGDRRTPPTGAQTAAVYRELMQRWKTAGRASREAEDELWARFKGAQDQFFHARSAVFAERDASLAANAEVKEELLIEAEKMLPVTDARSARVTLRNLLERWEAAGPVPREQRDRLEGGLRKVDEAVRKAEDDGVEALQPRGQGPRAEHGRPAAHLDRAAGEAPGQGAGAPAGPRTSRRPRRPSRPAAPGCRRPSARWPSSADPQAGVRQEWTPATRTGRSQMPCAHARA